MAWLDYEFDVNGQTVCARYRENTVRNLFLPLLANLSEIRRRTGERLVVFLAAPPAIGKSTLCCLLERLSSETRNLEPLRSVGIDGFHYPNAYLQNHAITVGKKRVLMREAKGSPDTYDTGRLGKALRSLSAGEDVM